MKTCSTRSNLRDQYLSDYCEQNDKQNPLYTVNDGPVYKNQQHWACFSTYIGTYQYYS